jgi:hypothetical protein
MSGAAGVQKPQTLDELMMAMDVVDTIRHSELVVERELAQGDRDASLRARLREIYRGQGLEVSDAAIDQGIKALRESRFAYTPPAPGLGRSLALFWIRRGVYGRWAGSALVVATALWGINYFGFELPRQRAVEQARIELSEELPRALKEAAGAARVETRDPAVIAQIDGLERDGQAALARGDVTVARTSVAFLIELRDRLVSTYVVNVVSGQNETSGVWRVPDNNPGARNYYLIVEAVRPDGTRQSVKVLNEETGKSETVTRWGVRVPESFFQSIRDDKVDNGIIEKNPVGTKARGELDPRYVFAKEGGAITSWDE